MDGDFREVGAVRTGMGLRAFEEQACFFNPYAKRKRDGSS